MAESAKAGDEVPLSIVPAESMEIVTVHYNEEPCTFVSSDAETNTFNYTFTMPASDVTLNIEVREMAPTEYSIYYDNSDTFNFVNVPQSAVSGTEITFYVNVTDLSLGITSIAYGSELGEFCKQEGDVKLQPDYKQYTFKFTMPASDVTLNIEVREMAPTEYSIYYDNSDTFNFVNVPQSAVSGTEITFYVNVTDLSLGITSIAYGSELGEFCKQEGDVKLQPDYKQYTFKFTMPAHDVSLDVTTATEYNDITLEGDDHAYINMLNALVKDDNGDPVLDEDGNKMYRGFYNQVVQFTYEVDLGYNYSVTIVGKRTGTHYEDQTIFEDNGWDFNSYWTLVMPAEPLTMTIKSSEKNDFVGKALVGNYKGFFINTTQLGKLERYDATTLEAEIKSNTAFSAKTTDANKFDFQGMISYDESTKQFAYDAASCEFYGLSGRYDDEMTVAWVSNLLEDMPDNVRFYIMSKNDLSSFISAGNAGGSKYLLEVKTSTGTAYYLFEREGYQLTKVDMEFTNGESLGDASATGFVMKEGKKLLQYTYDGSTTNLIEKGKEAGSYKPASGSGDELVLDGFGGGKIGTKEGTYTISDGIVTLTCDGQETKYNIDMNAKTYSPIADEGEWNGPTDFYVEGSQLAHDGGKDVKGCIKISIDKNAIGNPDKGKAYFVAQMRRNAAFNESKRSDNPSWIAAPLFFVSVDHAQAPLPAVYYPGD